MDLLMAVFEVLAVLGLGLGLRFSFLSIQKYGYNEDKEQSIIAVIPTIRLTSPG